MAKNGPIRDQRRQELIQATIAVIARHGYSGTTVARVARKAGVSTGLMNFHFDSKDRLFRATFDFLAAEYQAGLGPQSRCRRHCAGGAGDGDDRELFRPPGLHRRQARCLVHLLVGCRVARPLSGRCRPDRAALYRGSGEGDPPPDRRQPDGSPAEAKPVTAAVSAMVDGYWLQAMIYPKRFDRKAAVAACLAFLKLRLPRHLPEARPLAQAPAPR